MHQTITTLHEYRTRYPGSAAIPTLTQSGLLGLLLDRQRYKAAALTRRQGRWRSIFAAPGNLFVSIWRALIVAERSSDHVSRDRSDIGSPHQTWALVYSDV